MKTSQHVGPPPAQSLRWWGFDALVTLFVVGSAVPPLFHDNHEPLLVSIPVSAALTLPILVRRVWPVEVFGCLFLVAALAAVVQVRLAANISLVVALYTVAASQPRRRALQAAGLLELGTLAAVLRMDRTDWWNAAVLGSGMVAAALGLGLYAATRRAYLSELHDRAERLERERDQHRELAAAAERARITREMHDILAHHLTVMVALSDGAAATAAGSPVRAAEVMRTVSDTGRQALADTRQLLGGLGHEAELDASRRPIPDLAGLDALIDGVRAAGLPVSYEVQGASGVLAPGAQLAVYRLVQEGLTNALKHAGTGASATVRLHYLPGEIRVDIDDDGAGVPATRDALRPSSGRPPAGRGLAGMGERAHALGGEVQAGPRNPSGWRVSARLPIDGAVGT